MKDILIFTLRDLSKSGGGSIRINSLIRVFSQNRNVIVLSNNSSIEQTVHAEFDVRFNSFEKRIFQVLLCFLPVDIIRILFYGKLRRIEYLFQNYYSLDQDVIFCEHLDNSLGFYLKKRGIIKKSYINDVHGIASIELSKKIYQIPFVKSIVLYLAKRHEFKILSFASTIIYPSVGMYNFFKDNYLSFRNLKAIIIPNLISMDMLNSKLNINFNKKLVVKYNIDTNKQIIFFAGGYKELGGIYDLISVFAILLNKRKSNLLLLIVGDGFKQEKVNKHIDDLNLSNHVIQLGRQPYDKLFSIQQLANVIVCPDRMNDYSNLIVHLKYFDSIVSGIPVVCSGFDSVRDINKIGSFSVLYPPSNLKEMLTAIEFCLENETQIKNSFLKKKHLIKKHLTYESYKDIFNNL